MEIKGDVEEGEISDSGSVEEISEEDFFNNKPTSKPPRVWTMGDLCHRYPGFRTGLYNLAWAQAVQNKPLHHFSPPPPLDHSNPNPDPDPPEAELEEGEIDLDEPSPSPSPSTSNLLSLRETLAAVNAVDSEQSFDDVCSRIVYTLETSEGLPDALDDLLFPAVQVVNSVFLSMDLHQKELKKGSFSRLLSSITNYDPPVLSPGKLKEIELMMTSLSSVPSDEERDTTKANDMDTDSTAHDQTSVTCPSLASVLHSKPDILPEVSRPEVPAFKGRGLLLPLLDLHKDYDEDSLPSPTRDAPLRIPFQKPLGVVEGLAKPGPTMVKVVTGAEDPRLFRCETDAFKAVSSYQQKFGQSSFQMTDSLPSPTPSEEECDAEENDTNKEISSSNAVTNLRIPNLRPLVVPPSIPANGSITLAQAPAVKVTPSSSGLNPAIKASARSRDPRLRFANSDLSVLDLNPKPLSVAQNAPITETGEPMNSRKQRACDEVNLDNPASKRQRNAYENAGIASSDMKSLSDVVGRPEDNGTAGPPQLTSKNQSETAGADPRRSVLSVSNTTINGLKTSKEQVPIAGALNSLPELLKDIAGNPEILLNILKGQQQRISAVSQPKSDPQPNANLVPGSVNITPPSKALGVIQPPPANPLVTSQVGPMTTQDDPVKIRMKPRDPRRVLHGNTLQKIGGLVNEQLKTPAMKKDALNGHKIHEGLADKKPILAQSVDIARQFTKNLKNIADIMSVSAQTSTAIVSQDLSSQSVQVKSDRGDLQAVASKIEDQQSGTTTSTLEPTVSGPPRTPNTWGDVEHLFEGYDDQQKLAIQRERERRLGEQKKMFEARKLCLVLDLDHTLLNSAKFVEVDLVHDEILRKKEEQDREKPQRHLYRLPHMGMWTKLRPGIWNFLEKASKLFEMHLYTMGNKLYATEMAKVLDPKGTLFSGRVISRGDDGEPYDGDERVPKSKDLEGVLGMESSVVIIDDSVRVWPHNKLNLIIVERYTYFPCSRRQFGLPGPSLLEIDHDERPEDGTLASSLGVIERIHERFFSHKSLDEGDVRNILSSEQQKILGGCRIVFSRVFPVSEVNPHLHPLWQTAQQFGAVCTTQIDDQVTHVVANSAGTDKVNWALANGRFAVHPGWVEASALLYRRANELDFAIKPAPPT